MSAEGGGSFEKLPSFSQRRERGRATPYEKLPEVVGGEGERPPSWLERFMTPERLAQAQESPYGENRSPESLLLEALTGVLVEQAPEWDAAARARLRNFVNVFRIAAFPNMLPHEQRLIQDIDEGNDYTWSKQEIELDEVGHDIRQTFRGFGFTMPTPNRRETERQQTRQLPSSPTQADQGGEGRKVRGHLTSEQYISNPLERRPRNK